MDDGTGTITGRSLRGYLARQVPGLAIRAPEFGDTVATSPPLISQWNPRLHPKVVQIYWADIVPDGQLFR